MQFFARRDAYGKYIHPNLYSSRIRSARSSEQAFEKFNYYHVEMFIALPGKQKELLKQREMENVYLKEIDRDPNFIFTRLAGSVWDIFTIGCYRDIKHFAESAPTFLSTQKKKPRSKLASKERTLSAAICGNS